MSISCEEWKTTGGTKRFYTRLRKEAEVAAKVLLLSLQPEQCEDFSCRKRQLYCAL